MDELLRELGLVLEGEYSKDGQYVVDLYDSNEFGKVYSALDNSKDTEELYDSSLLTTHNANISYILGDYQLTLSADFDEELYKLVITEYEYVEDEEEDE